VAAVILVVDDEPDVVSLASDILAMKGYRVLEATGAAQALTVSQGHADSIDLLLTDLAMPDMTGRQLFDELSRRRPGLRAIFMSGLTREMIADYGVPEGAAFVIKPFTAERLLDKVAQVLAQKPRVPWPRRNR
jgi:DNA-binding NtrC family response regulator